MVKILCLTALYYAPPVLLLHILWKDARSFFSGPVLFWVVAVIGWVWLWAWLNEKYRYGR